jgi:acetyl-CoA synthetase
VDTAAIGKHNPEGGESVKVFVVLKEGWVLNEELVEEIKRRVAEYIGPIAVPTEVEALEGLPRTRSGKILRRFLRDKESAGRSSDSIAND